MAIAVFDQELKTLRSSLDLEIPRNILKSILGNLKMSGKQNFSFKIQLHSEDFTCYTYGESGVVGLTKNRRFALYKTKDIIVFQFHSNDLPESCFESTKKYALNYRSSEMDQSKGSTTKKK